MDEIAIIIPSRLAAERLPNKPLKIINNKEMILHVYDAAKSTNIGNVYVATPDKKIIDIVNNYGGQAKLTELKHQTGTDRVFEVFDKVLERKPQIIINLQGDMPNIDPYAIKVLIGHMKKNLCDIGTLASKFKNKKEVMDINSVKVIVKDEISQANFSTAIDFIRTVNNSINNKTLHHVGIYAFTNKALIRYVELKRSKLEVERNLEQLRALENNMKIDVGYINSSPLSIDTNDDLIEVKKLMEKNEEK